MAELGDSQKVVTLEELAISNMYQFGTLIELLEKRESSPNRKFRYDSGATAKDVTGRY